MPNIFNWSSFTINNLSQIECINVYILLGGHALEQASGVSAHCYCHRPSPHCNQQEGGGGGVDGGRSKGLHSGLSSPRVGFGSPLNAPWPIDPLWRKKSQGSTQMWNELIGFIRWILSAALSPIIKSGLMVVGSVVFCIWVDAKPFLHVCTQEASSDVSFVKLSGVHVVWHMHVSEG